MAKSFTASGCPEAKARGCQLLEGKECKLTPEAEGDQVGALHV